MNCPVCHDSRMKEVEKNGVLIDICPSCKGVWLDRGELDKLMGEVREVRDEYNRWYYDEDGDRRQAPRHDAYPQHGHKRKKRSVMDMFGDLFD